MTVPSLAILDNTVLSNFALAQSTHLVFQLWTDGVYTTAEVMDEYRAGVALGVVPADVWSGIRVVELSDAERAKVVSFPQNLGIGEKSYLAVASCRGGSLVSDDLDARNTAVSLGLQLTGTVGVLIACVRREIVDLREANQKLTIMIVEGYHSPVSRLDRLI